MDERFEKLSDVGADVTIALSEKSLTAMKIMYACGGHELESFSEFVKRAAEVALEARLFDDVSDEVAARIHLLSIGKDPFIPEDQLSSETGMPPGAPNSSGLFRKNRNYSVWGSIWKKQRYLAWYDVPPRWLRR